MPDEVASTARPAAAVTAPAPLDPVTLELVRNALHAIVSEMTVTLMRAAHSSSAVEARDFSVGLFDGDGGAIAQSPGAAPMSGGDLGPVIRRGRALFQAEGFQPGDAVLSNDAESSGEHVSGVAVFAPIFAGGALVAFAAARSRWPDVGGMAVGSASSRARDVFSEGVQLPFLKAWRAGAPDEAVLRLVRANTRFPDQVIGDLQAQILACRAGEKRFLELVGRHGADTAKACVHRMWDEEEAVARRAVQAMPDGVYEAACELDNDGIHLERAVALHVSVSIAGSDMTVDFTGMSDQVEGPCNSRSAESIARAAFRFIAAPRSAASEGAFRNLKVVCPEGKLVKAHPGAPRGGSTLVLVSTIDLILRALQPALPERVAAGHPDNLNFAGWSGADARTGRPFHGSLPYLGGWGASAHADGAGAVVSLAQGDVRFTPVEVQETLEPVRVRRLALRPDSGGAGRQRGGLGIEFEREALADCYYHGRYERTNDAPWGASGGKPGRVTHVRIVRDGKETAPPLKCEYYALRRGDIEIVHTGGGGGHGSPWEREPERVRRDVVEGYVTPQAARDEYGVVIDPKTLALDAEATRARRDKMPAAPK